MKNRVVHFEIQADNPERAMKFYKEVFGWEFEKWGKEMYWTVLTAPRNSTEPGINGGLVARSGGVERQAFGINAYICTIEVEDFDDISEKIEVAGGTVSMPKYAIADMAWQGYFLDTEGNTFGVHQAEDPALE